MPLTFDFPFEQLITYQGINPRPADFDDYWEKAVAEMHSVDPKVALEPAEFQVPGVECFHLYFSGVGGRPGACKIPASRKDHVSLSCRLDLSRILF